MTYANPSDKEVRKIVFNKYNKRCAYCGIKLDVENWHIDHILPMRRKERNIPNGPSTIENYNPSCPSCNLSKGVYSIDTWLKELHHKLVSINRDVSNFRILKRFGLVKETGRPVIFYFEKVNHG